MNLSQLYDLIFYPAPNTGIPKMTKKNFLLELIPRDARMNAMVYQDKARRSRFYKDSFSEQNYINSLIKLLERDSFLISRFEKDAIDFVNEINDNSCSILNVTLKNEVNRSINTISQA